MVRTMLLGLSIAGVLCAAAGCAHFVEMQAIKHFTTALEQGNLDAVKASASETFDQKALRRKDALDAIKIIKLHPEEKVDIVKVEDVSDTEKKVVVTTAKTHRRMLYKLVRDPSGKWVVDDIVVKKTGKDVTAAKSVTEQMDLLLVVQDFLVAWHAGERKQVQAVTTDSFGKLLGELPAAHLERLTKKVAGERIRPEEFRPEAQIDDKYAVVKLQRTKGVLLLKMKQTSKGWKVDDLSIESRNDKDHIASAVATATVIHTVVKFLKAYQEDDKTSLQKLGAPKFYDECLKVADLSMIPLPAPNVLGDKDIVKTQDKTGEYILRRDPQTVKITLTVPAVDGEDSTTSAKNEQLPSSAPAFVVDDVTIYDAKEEKRLSAMFTAQAKMQLFMRALMKGDLTLVKENSTSDLKTKVLNRLGPLSLIDIVPPEIEMVPPKITGSNFHGSVIKIHVQQGTRDLTYVLHDWSGKVTVDDILMPVMDRPAGMKDTMRTLLPLRLFRAALRDASLAADSHDRSINILKQVSSQDFNRLIWTQVAEIPEWAFNVLPHLEAPLAEIKETPTGQTVILGDAKAGAKIELTRERDVLVVDRIWLIGGSDNDPPELKSALKEQLAKHGPRGLAMDSMSDHPIATEPVRTVDADASADGETDGAIVPQGAAQSPAPLAKAARSTRTSLPRSKALP